jgi:hypothetical protein
VRHPYLARRAPHIAFAIAWTALWVIIITAEQPADRWATFWWGYAGAPVIVYQFYRAAREIWFGLRRAFRAYVRRRAR